MTTDAATLRKIDALVAEHIFGKAVNAQGHVGEDDYSLPLYSSDGNAMLALIEKMKDDGWWISQCHQEFMDDDWYVTFTWLGADQIPRPPATGWDSTLPEAVARAALAVYGVEVEE